MSREGAKSAVDGQGKTAVGLGLLLTSGKPLPSPVTAGEQLSAWLMTSPVTSQVTVPLTRLGEGLSPHLHVPLRAQASPVLEADSIRCLANHGQMSTAPPGLQPSNSPGRWAPKLREASGMLCSPACAPRHAYAESRWDKEGVLGQFPRALRIFTSCHGHVDFWDSVVRPLCSRKCQTEVVTLASDLGLGKAVAAASVVCGCR